MSISPLCRLDDFLIGGIRPAVTDIFHDIFREKIYILLDDTNLIPEIFQLDFPDIGSVDEDPSLIHIVESRDQAAESGFSTSGASHDGEIFSGMDLQIHMA